MRHTVKASKSVSQAGHKKVVTVSASNGSKTFVRKATLKTK